MKFSDGDTKKLNRKLVGLIIAAIILKTNNQYLLVLINLEVK